MNRGFELLGALDQQVRAHMLPLPARDELPDLWSGLGFEVGGQRFVAPEGQITEVLQPPAITALPGVKRWLRGIANVRGRLIPIADFAAFLGTELRGSRADWRVFIVEVDDHEFGLLADYSHGMQHFEADAELPADQVLEVRQALPAHVHSSLGTVFRLAGRAWQVFDLHALLRTPGLFEVAA